MANYLVARGMIRYGGTLYKRGSVFEADSSEVAFLIKSGKLVSVDKEPDVSVKEGISNESSLTGLVTVKEFEEFKADKQKEILESIGVEPASNKENRVQQYADYLESGKDEHKHDEDNGPNTGLPV